MASWLLCVNLQLFTTDLLNSITGPQEVHMLLTSLEVQGPRL